MDDRRDDRSRLHDGAMVVSLIMRTLLIGLLAAAPEGSRQKTVAIAVQEEVAPARVKWQTPHGKVERAAGPRPWGKLGWSFDVDSDCNVFLVEAAPEATGTTSGTQAQSARLVALPLGRSDGGAVLATSSSGLSSPAVSPDGTSVLLVRGEDELIQVNSKDGSVRLVGRARFAVWEEDGTIDAYARTDGGCHALQRFGNDLTPEKTITTCAGFNAMPVASGPIPKGAPIPIIDSHRAVVALLGFEDAEVKEHIQLSTVERGIGCTEGVDFVSTDGDGVTLVKRDGRWRLQRGDSCGAIKARRGFVKALQCNQKMQPRSR